MFLFWPGFGHTRTHESVSIRPSCLGVWLGSSSHGRQIRSLAFCILAGLGLPWLHTHMPRFCSHTRIPFSLSFGAWCTCQWCHTHTCGCQRTRTVILLLGFGSSFYSDSSALCVAKIRIWNKKKNMERKKSFLSPSTLDRIRFSFLDNKIGYLDSSNFRNRSCDLLWAVSGWRDSGFLFFFYIYFDWIFEKSY